MNGLPPGFDIAAAMKMLQQVKKIAEPLKLHDISIRPLKVIPDKVELDRCFEQAKEKLKAAITYNIASYDLPWLRDTTLDQIEEAMASGKDSITFKNRCCSFDTCPELLFVNIFVKEIISMTTKTST